MSDAATTVRPKKWNEMRLKSKSVPLCINGEMIEIVQ